MNKVKIIADSTVDLNKEMYEELGIEVLPLTINFGTEVFKDSVEITPDEMYARIEKDGELPHTAAIPPAVIEEAFRKAIKAGCDVIFTGIGSKFSTTYQNAIIAKGSIDNADDRIFILDSQNLSTGTGLLVLKMCKLRDEGKSAKEIFDIVSPMVPLVSAQFVVDKLDYLHKGGRCSGASKIFGHILHVHPVIKVVDGGMIVHDKPRGRLSAGIDRQVLELKNDLPNVDMDNIMITDSGVSEDDKQYFHNEVAKLVDPKVIRHTRAGCVISCHCGPGTIGVLYIKTK